MALIGIGNPLLDASITCGDDTLLKKYKLTRGAAILSSPNHMPLYDEVHKHSTVQYIAGGSCLNTMRAFQWMTQRPFLSGFIGCVGDDINGKKLTDIVANAGVRSLFMQKKDFPTGVCAVLVNNKERTMVTHLGAAEQFQHNHFESPEVQKAVADCKVMYAEGYFCTVSAASLIAMGKHACAQNKPFAFSLSAQFLIQVDPFWKVMEEVLTYVDVVFCNDTEALTLAERCNFSKDLDVVAKQMAEMPKANKLRQRMIVITCGADPTIVYHNGKLYKIRVPFCAKTEIVDTNGAGDCFAGGYLSEFVMNSKSDVAVDVSACVRAGQYCALVCIKSPGCTLNGFPQHLEPSALIAKATAFAAKKHVKQTRKSIEKEPYIGHPIGVMNNLTEAGIKDVTVLQAALLHDTIEDTATTYEELENKFGTSVAKIVAECTDDKSKSKLDRKKFQIEHAPHISNEAKLVKLADKIHNIESMVVSSPWDEARTRGYFVWGYNVCVSLFGVNAMLDARAWTVFDHCDVIHIAASSSSSSSSGDKYGIASLKGELEAYYKLMEQAKD